jgi:hypothetical protein
MHPFQNMSQESDNMVTAATQPEQNRISSSPVQKHESNPTLNGNEPCCLAVVVTLPNVDSQFFMLLLFILVPGQGTTCVPLEYGYEAWENKDKVENIDQKDSDHGDKNCIGGYHEDNNTTYTS